MLHRSLLRASWAVALAGVLAASGSYPGRRRPPRVRWSSWRLGTSLLRSDFRGVQLGPGNRQRLPPGSDRKGRAAGDSATRGVGLG